MPEAGRGMWLGGEIETGKRCADEDCSREPGGAIHIRAEAGRREEKDVVVLIVACMECVVARSNARPPRRMTDREPDWQKAKHTKPVRTVQGYWW